MQRNGISVILVLFVFGISAVHHVWAGPYAMRTHDGSIELEERKPWLTRDDWNDASDVHTRRIKRQQFGADAKRVDTSAGTATTTTTSNSGNGGGMQTDAIIRFQDYLLQAKSICARELRYDGDVDKSLLYEPLPTPQEKCLIECILKRTDLMKSNNRLSVQRIGSVAELVSGRNPLVVSIAMATADHCNRFIDASNPCEAASQINQCIANELKTRKIKLFY